MRTGKKFKKSDYIIMTVIVILFVYMNLMSIRMTNRSISSRINSIATLRLDSISTELQSFLSEAENSLDVLRIGIEEMFNSGKSKNEIEDFVRSYKASQLLKTNGVNFNTYIASKEYTYIPDFNMPDDYHATERNWYVGATMKNGSVFITEPYIDQMTGELCYTLSKQVENTDIVVALDFTLSKIQETIDKMLADENDYKALIVSKEGTIVGYSDMSYVGGSISKDLPAYNEIFDRVVRSGIEKDMNIDLEDDSYSFFSSHTENGWYLMLFAKRSVFYSDVSKQIVVRFILFGVILFAMLYIYIYSVKQRYKAEKATDEKDSFIAFVSDGIKKPLKELMSVSTSETERDRVSSIKESGYKLSNVLEKIDEYGQKAKEEINSRKNRYKSKELSKTIRRSRYVIIIIFVFTILANAFLNYRMANNIEDALIENKKNTYNYQLQKWIERQNNALDMFCDYVAAEPKKADDYENFVSWLNKIASNNPDISACYLANPHKEHTVIMNTGWEPEEGFFVEDRQWYKETILSETGYSISSPYIDEQTGMYCITFSKIIYVGDDFIGVFGIDCLMDKLVKIMGDSYSDDCYAFLTDQNGTILNHPDKEMEMSKTTSINISDTCYAEVDRYDTPINFTDYDDRWAIAYKCSDESSKLNLYIIFNWLDMNKSGIFIVAFSTAFLTICMIIANIMITRMIEWQNGVNVQLEEAVEYATNAGKAKSKFLAQMSHEIRTPINAVIGMNEMILRESDEPQVREYAANIRSAGKTLLELINSILDFSKIEEGKMELFPVKYDITAVADYLINMISEKVSDKGLQLICDIDPTLPKSLFGDDVRLKQVVLNLLTNAVKYTRKGSVTLKMTGKALNEDEYELRVSVIDTGIGIKAEDKDKLFVSFERLDEIRNRNIEGTGLGISIVSGLLDMMESRLEVESTYGKGSDFSFRVKQEIIDPDPIGEFKQHIDEKAFVKKQSFKVPKNTSILVIDDNDMNLKVAKGLFKLNCIVPDLASSGAEGIEKVKNKKYDLIFLDHMMPGMDGIETLRRMKGILDKDTKVICLTANAIEGVREEYLREGFDDYLSKPIEVDALDNILYKYLKDKGRDEITDSEVLEFYPEDSDTDDSSEDKAASESKVIEASDVSHYDAENPDKELDFWSILKNASINTDAGISYAGGMKDFYIEMLKDFVATYMTRTEELNGDFSKKDWKDYSIKVHALKSNTKMLGMDALSELAKSLERASKEENEEAVKNEHDNMMSAYEKMTNVVRKALEHMP